MKTLFKIGCVITYVALMIGHYIIIDGIVKIYKDGDKPESK